VSDGGPIVWVNGRRLAPDAPHVSARDRGFTLADGVFETMKAHNRRVFRLDSHLTRIEGALRTLQIPVPAELREWVLAAIDAGELAHGVVRLTVTRGVGPGGVAAPADPAPTVVVIVTSMPPPANAVYEQGVSAHVASGRRNEHAMTSGLKTLAFTDAIAATLEAQRAGADEALFLDVAGHCSEGAASNVFAVVGGTVVTPPLTCGVLPGITRATVLGCAPGLGLSAVERILGLEELAAADEAFLTSSFRGVVPLVRLNRRAIGTGTPGVITRQIMAAYGALVSGECGA
jgi:branched-chain amino acid aminotransferase